MFCNLYYNYIYIHIKLLIMKTINYTTRTFYVPASKMDTLLEFQEKCRANGRKSYSEVLLELMQQYNGNN